MSTAPTAKIIPITPVEQLPVEGSSQAFIKNAYSRLAAISGFNTRDGQIRLSNSIATALINNIPIAAEAPTGTGKTLAYCIAGIAASRAISPEGKVPVVIGTATNGLQQQIITGDIPKLIEAGLVDSDRVILAKGRGRYFCIASAHRFVDGDDSTQYDLFDANSNDHVEATMQVAEMLEKWTSADWDGDKDNWKEKLSAAWDLVKASADTCTNKRCDYYTMCPFFKERMKMADAEIIVANHDLILADLAMAKQEQGEPLFPSGRYIGIFDEAHNLPDKAIEAGGCNIDLEQCATEFEALSGFSHSLFRNHEISKVVSAKNIGPDDLNPSEVCVALRDIAKSLAEQEVDEDSKVHRYPLGQIPAELKDKIKEALFLVGELADVVGEVVNRLKNSKVDVNNPGLKLTVAEILYNSSFIGTRLKECQQGLKKFTSDSRLVRWVYRNEAVIRLCSSPLEGADVLNEVMWSTARIIPAMVSATIKGFDDYGRFKYRAGMPENTITETLEHIFPYQENHLVLANMKYTPRMTERADYLKELAAALPAFIKPKEGTLVLFGSKAAMNAVMPSLRAKFGSSVRAQHEQSFSDLIASHKAAIDSGNGSILCGLATLAEGLDLPGKYCSHVCITAIPFAVPTSPVEAELQELLGREYFMQRSLPDAFIKLTQQVGRLMRRESDRGRVTVFDTRLSRATSWGRLMLDNLPPFRKRYERAGDRTWVDIPAI